MTRSEAGRDTRRMEDGFWAVKRGDEYLSDEYTWATRCGHGLLGSCDPGQTAGVGPKVPPQYVSDSDPPDRTCSVSEGSVS